MLTLITFFTFQLFDTLLLFWNQSSEYYFQHSCFSFNPNNFIPLPCVCISKHMLDQNKDTFSKVDTHQGITTLIHLWISKWPDPFFALSNSVPPIHSCCLAKHFSPLGLHLFGMFCKNISTFSR